MKIYMRLFEIQTTVSHLNDIIAQSDLGRTTTLVWLAVKALTFAMAVAVAARLSVVVALLPLGARVAVFCS